MKPILTNNISAWGYVGLFILFSIPVIGTLAMIICAVFMRNSEVGAFARGMIIFTLIYYLLAVVLDIIVINGIIDLSQLGFYTDSGVEVFNNVRGYIGF